ncbi:RING finger protein 207-like [Aquarana catesbeiana]|uniref:RING finger protein 207-like n=1 Tax=Aquarana catesbeiana TaxID=8400 RepID=UPI003CCA424B
MTDPTSLPLSPAAGHRHGAERVLWSEPAPPPPAAVLFSCVHRGGGGGEKAHHAADNAAGLRSFINKSTIWEETYQRVANEQEIYEAQLHDLQQLKQENGYLTTITKQIAPYVQSIAKVKERLEPRLKEPQELKDDVSEKTSEDSSMLELHGRNEVTTCTEDQHEKPPELKFDNRTLDLLNDDVLLISKDYYRLTQNLSSWKGLNT